jgi:hypothetical protein
MDWEHVWSTPCSHLGAILKGEIVQVSLSKKKQIVTIFSLVAFTQSGCGGILRLMKADPAPPSGFIDQPEKMVEMRHHAPFHSLWFKNRDWFDKTRGKYKSIYFKPITTKFVLDRGWWSSLNSVDREQYQKDLEEIARFGTEAFREAFRNDPQRRHAVVDVPDKETIVYEIALTELIATKAHINAAGTALGAVVPGGGLIKSAAKGSVAIEVKVIDGESNELIIAWADREQDQSSLFSFSDFVWYAHARKSFSTWAEQLVTLHNVTTNDLVEDSLPFTLDPS